MDRLPRSPLTQNGARVRTSEVIAKRSSGSEVSRAIDRGIARLEQMAVDRACRVDRAKVVVATTPTLSGEVLLTITGELDRL